MDVLLFVGNVGSGTWITEFLCQSKINDIDEVRGFANAHDKVGGFDVAVDKGVGVDEFDAGYLEGV